MQEPLHPQRLASVVQLWRAGHGLDLGALSRGSEAGGEDDHIPTPTPAAVGCRIRVYQVERERERPAESGRCPVEQGPSPVTGPAPPRPLPRTPAQHPTPGGAPGPERWDHLQHRGFSTSASAVAQGPAPWPFLQVTWGWAQIRAVEEGPPGCWVFHHSLAHSFTQFNHPGVILDSCLLSAPLGPIHQDLLFPRP